MRVAALLPAATEIVIALGAGDQLVAVTHACTLPARLASIPRVTRSRVSASDPGDVDAAVTELAAAGAPLFDLDAELLAAQRPDVILTQAVCDVCAVREEDARAVAARLRPPPRLATLRASTVDGILADIEAVGAALDVPDDAEELVAGLRSRIAAVHRALKQRQPPRPRIVVIEWTDPPFGAGHWVPDMVRRAGGVDLIGRSGEVSRRTTEAAIKSASPDAIVIAPCGVALSDATKQAEAMLSNDAWTWARRLAVWAIDANALTSSPGPGVIHGIEVLAKILHPAVFGPPSVETAVQIAVQRS